jgi:hypothetical protein
VLECGTCHPGHRRGYEPGNGTQTFLSITSASRSRRRRVPCPMQAKFMRVSMRVRRATMRYL